MLSNCIIHKRFHFAEFPILPGLLSVPFQGILGFEVVLGTPPLVTFPCCIFAVVVVAVAAAAAVVVSVVSFVL